MKKLAHQQAGELGEALALAKLNTLNLAAYSSPPGAPGHDLIVVSKGRAHSIEVKTRQFAKSESEIGRWPVDMKTKAGADFFLFVALDIRTMTPSFYLLTREQALSCHKDYSGSGNCVPSAVKATVAANDFRALL